jgi:hypothetical protein
LRWAPYLGVAGRSESSLLVIGMSPCLAKAGGLR